MFEIYFLYRLESHSSQCGERKIQIHNTKCRIWCTTYSFSGNKRKHRMMWPFLGLWHAYDLVQRCFFSFGHVQNQNDLLEKKVLCQAKLVLASSRYLLFDIKRPQEVDFALMCVQHFWSSCGQNGQLAFHTCDISKYQF